MRITYIAITVLAATMNACAAALSLAGAEYVTAVAERVHVSTRLTVPFGLLLASGSVGLLAGFAAPALGTAAAAGLTAYFIAALGAHLRVRDRGIGGAVGFLVVALAALAADVVYRHPWW